MVQTGHNAYIQNAGNSVINKDQLLLKLLEGSLNFLRLARRAMEENNTKIKGENISKILAIVSELDCALDMEAGGEIAENLSSLYQHIIYRLVETNVKNDIKGIDEVGLILENIKDGFQEAVRINRSNQTEAQEQSKPVLAPEATEQKGGMSLAI